jgi:hypothetical protein
MTTDPSPWEILLCGVVVVYGLVLYVVDLLSIARKVDK